ncbi:ATP-binding protein [Rhizobium sp. BK251]|uniref:ATP-binding protein n=1 Tax=Rhizobium sp. BK251 TaxID=2512125 RepID=UPI00104A0A28|nr:ATP-binding protein [Rhizobium sp. BK251]TCL68445.1 histidine kinase/DNA gyrase B/HSP90-like ATPase [Rhizobium sp. BK251]
MRTRGEDVILEQRNYARLENLISRHGLTLDEAFIRGIRHIGYRSNLHAFAELIDNSIQAYAQRIDLIFGYDETSSLKKPNRIAIVDDGHGMPPEMLRLAMMWGGTHRENDRDGLGRYGYGLPCAAVSIGRRFSVISKIEGGVPFQVTLDLDALDMGHYRNSEGHLAMPAPQAADIPDFVEAHLASAYPEGWQSGTVVVIEKLDRLEWATTAGIRTNLIRHLGVIYHKMADLAALHVGDTRIEPVDPLFLSHNAILHDLDEDRAVALEPIDVRILNPATGQDAIVTLRYSWLPPTFGAIDKSRDAVGLNANARFPILKEFHGVIFSRNGRLIDVHSRIPWTIFVNNDRYIRVEIEFSAKLDELFGVTTSKQQVTVSPSVWDALRQAGLHKAIEQLRAKVRIAKTAKCTELNQVPLPLPGGQVQPARRDEHPDIVGPILPAVPATLWQNNGGRNISLNRQHPLFSGAKDGKTTAAALEKLVEMIANRAGCAGVELCDEYCGLLDAWGEWVRTSGMVQS